MPLWAATPELAGGGRILRPPALDERKKHKIARIDTATRLLLVSRADRARAAARALACGVSPPAEYAQTACVNRHVDTDFICTPGDLRRRTRLLRRTWPSSAKARSSGSPRPSRRPICRLRESSPATGKHQVANAGESHEGFRVRTKCNKPSGSSRPNPRVISAARALLPSRSASAMPVAIASTFLTASADFDAGYRRPWRRRAPTGVERRWFVISHSTLARTVNAVGWPARDLLRKTRSGTTDPRIDARVLSAAPDAQACPCRARTLCITTRQRFAACLRQGLHRRTQATGRSGDYGQFGAGAENRGKTRRSL